MYFFKNPLSNPKMLPVQEQEVDASETAQLPEAATPGAETLGVLPAPMSGDPAPLIRTSCFHTPSTVFTTSTVTSVL